MHEQIELPEYGTLWTKSQTISGSLSVGHHGRVMVCYSLQIKEASLSLCGCAL